MAAILSPFAVILSEAKNLCSLSMGAKVKR